MSGKLYFTRHGLIRLCEHQCLNQAMLFVKSPTSFGNLIIGTHVKILQDGKKMVVVWDIVSLGESDPNRNMLAYNAIPFLFP